VDTFKVTSGAKACHFASSKKMGPTTRAMGGDIFAEKSGRRLERKV